MTKFAGVVLALFPHYNFCHSGKPGCPSRKLVNRSRFKRRDAHKYSARKLNPLDSDARWRQFQSDAEWPSSI